MYAFCLLLYSTMFHSITVGDDVRISVTADKRGLLCVYKGCSKHMHVSKPVHFHKEGRTAARRD